MLVPTVLTLVLALLCGCSIRTAGAPRGRLTLTATFDDVQNLVTGHSVQLADVKVGTVTGVRLEGHRAKVTMSVKDGVRIPQGTSAEIAVTSLLGENFVRLTLPPGGDLSKGPFLADGAKITKTRVQPSFEQVVGQAGPIISALANNDLATVVDAGATAFGGKGDRLNAMVGTSSRLLALFAGQRQELGVAVDRFARLGRELAKGEDEFAQAPEQLEKTTWALKQNKDKALRTIRELTRLARLMNDKVLEGRVVRLRTMLRRLDPVLKTLGDNRARLTALLEQVVNFEAKVPRAVYDGQLLLYPLLRLVLPNGSTIPGGGSPGTGATGGTGRTGDELRLPLPAPGTDQRPPRERVPEGIRDVLPDLDDLLGGGR
ncbi:MCE family protein [Actinomadura alba]|uniref:MCE family protein n=1 Tax=Actinomadura alba TaxID=406431 RepID=A0ABR7LNS0_9ACTN|nr:MCE family protein [Actinomadura alba]